MKKAFEEVKDKQLYWKNHLFFHFLGFLRVQRQNSSGKCFIGTWLSRGYVAFVVFLFFFRCKQLRIYLGFTFFSYSPQCHKKKSKRPQASRRKFLTCTRSISLAPSLRWVVSSFFHFLLFWCSNSITRSSRSCNTLTSYLPHQQQQQKHEQQQLPTSRVYIPRVDFISAPQFVISSRLTAACKNPEKP